MILQPSIRKAEKIDIYYVNGEYVTSVGALGMGDFPTYLTTKVHRDC